MKSLFLIYINFATKHFEMINVTQTANVDLLMKNMQDLTLNKFYFRLFCWTHCDVQNVREREREKGR